MKLLSTLCPRNRGKDASARICAVRFAVLLVGALLIFIGTKAYAFSDITPGSHYETAFDYLAEKNILKGFPDGSARPGASLSRVEGLTAVLRSREQFAPQVVWFSDNLPDIALFSDTEQNAWYAPYIEVGFLEGIVTGKGDGTFGPGESLTVDQALVMLQRAYGNGQQELSYGTSERLSNTPNQWFSNAVSMAVARNLIPPTERLSLGSPITRGQFFSILYRLHSIDAKNQYAFVDAPTAVAVLSTPVQVFAEPQTAAEPLPITVNPLPFNPNDPYFLELPPPNTSTGPTEASSGGEEHEYGSNKEFAITIPSLNLMDVTITHPNDPFSHDGILSPLKEGLGHLFAYPGQTGKTMIYGHSSSYPWDISEYTRIFRQINKLVPGERVYLTHDGNLYVYEVSRKQVVDASDVTPFDDDGTSELILYTCWPPDSIKQRYLVHAVPVETVALR